MDYFFYNTDADSLIDPPIPRYPILINHGFAAVGGDRQQFGEQLRQLAPDDVLVMYENRVGVVAVGRVRAFWDGLAHTEFRYYSPAESGNLSGGPHEYRIAVDWFLDLSEAPIGVDVLRDRLGYIPRGTVRRILARRGDVARLIEEAQAVRSLLPGEMAQPSRYVEGAVRQVSVNAYERSREAVQQCKEVHGTACIICGFDFEAVYGSGFAGFIHVHHRRPLSEIGSEYVVEPVTDLCPVCPNCHAVIHYGGQLRSIEEVRQLLKRRNPTAGDS